MRIRIAAALALLGALGAVARAEDTAAVLAALTDKEAEDRYMIELCTRVARATAAAIVAIDSVTTCANADCETFDALRVEEAAAVAARDVTVASDLSTATVYRSKRNAEWLLCEPSSASGRARVDARRAPQAIALRERTIRHEEHLLGATCDRLGEHHKLEVVSAQLLKLVADSPKQASRETVGEKLQEVKRIFDEAIDIEIGLLRARSRFKEAYGRDPASCASMGNKEEVQAAFKAAMDAVQRRAKIRR